MKFNIMIGGVETLFPETEVMLFKKKYPYLEHIKS